MHLVTRALEGLRHEGGSVLVFVALGLPTLIAVFALSIDVGNWFVHKRSLQNEVDAAALAGAALWGGCFSGDPGQAFVDMQAEATKYNGTGTALYNAQIGGATKGPLTVLYNSRTYAKGGPGPDDTGVTPCTTPYIFDVKGTEANIPLLFAGFLPGLSSLSQLNAHARVELRQAKTFSHLAPIAVPTPSPNFAFARFVDETTGNVPAGCASPCEMELHQTTTVGGVQMWAPLPGVSATFPIPAKLGVRFRLVGGTDKTAACGSTLVDCYDSGSANGAVFVRGWNAATAAPTVHDIMLLPGSGGTACAPDAYFASASCSAGVRADVDLGVIHPLTGTHGESAEVDVSVDGGSAVPLTAGGTSGLIAWSLGSGLALSGSGPHAISLSWKWKQTSGTWNGSSCTTKNNNPCADSGSFAGSAFHRAFVADPTRSGPIQLAQVYQPGVTSMGSNSFQTGSTQSLAVAMGTLGSLSVQSQAGDPAVILRVTSGVHGQTQSIDCDPALSNTRDEIINGCAPRYTTNTGAACVFDPSPQPWNCVSIQTGGAVGQVEQGLAARIAASCGAAPNNWPNWKSGDRRILSVFLTPFNTFRGSGNGLVPLIGAATFYVTGWNGDPCLSPGQYPAKGDIVGHFIGYASPDPGSASGNPCDPAALIPCVPVLTK